MVTKLTIEYDGTDFAGWARQPGKRTVQEELERALATVLGELAATAAAALTVAGRTDRGRARLGSGRQLRARGGRSAARSTRLLPDDIAVLACEPAPRASTRAAMRRSRTYCYRVLARRTALRVRARPRATGGPAASTARRSPRARARSLGTHDFTAFTPTETEHVRFERDVLARRVAPARATCSSSGSRPTRSCAT